MGTLRAQEAPDQMRMAQFRWKIGTALLWEEEWVKVKSRCAGSTGVGVEAVAAKTAIRDSFCEAERNGFAGYCGPCFSAQHFMPQVPLQWAQAQACEANLAHPGKGCAANICPTNRRLNNMANSRFTALSLADAKLIAIIFSIPRPE